MSARMSLRIFDNRIMDAYQASIREIPLLSHKETLELGRQKDECKDEAIRKSLIKKLAESNLRLVVKVALGFRNSSIDAMDLIQEGNQGLLRAAEKFDYRQGVLFSTYAVYWIRAYIIRYIFLNNNTIREPIKFQQHRNILNSIIAEKRAISGEYPDLDELCESSGIKSERVRHVIEDGVKRVGNLIVDGDREISFIDSLPDQDADTFDEELDDLFLLELPWELHEQIISHCGKEQTRVAGKRSFQAFLMYYYHRMTLQEIGDHFNVTRERARQLRDKFHERLTAKYIAIRKPSD